MSPNQVDEMFRLLTTAVTKLNEHDARFEKIEQGQAETRQDLETQGRKLDDFIVETRQNFVEVKTEIKEVKEEVAVLTERFNNETKNVSILHGQQAVLKNRIIALEQKEAA